MKVLIVYDLFTKSGKSTINEYLQSFKKNPHTRCYYLNTAYGIPKDISKINFDLIIFTTTFFDPNVRLGKYARYKTVPGRELQQLKGYKVAIPQDEYRCSDRMNQFFNDCDIKTVFTLVSEREWQKIYPREKSGIEHYIKVLTGYIDEDTTKRLRGLYRSHKSRQIDIGYRAHKPPFWLGKQGMIKQRLVEKFLNTPIKHNLKLDLSTDYKDILPGNKWYRFLGECRVVLGCEGGSSLHDPDGCIKEQVDQYVSQHPEATFEEVEQACFRGLDGNLGNTALSPRHFDACVTRTCQALVEGEYGGIFKPGVHYIEIKRDWSNVAEVIKQIEDVDFCERIADNAYRDIVESGLYTYQNFVQQVFSHVESVHGSISGHDNDDLHRLKLLELREKLPLVFSPLACSVEYFKVIVYTLLVKLKLYEFYKSVETLLNKRTIKNL